MYFIMQNSRSLKEAHYDPRPHRSMAAIGMNYHTYVLLFSLFDSELYVFFIVKTGFSALNSNWGKWESVNRTNWLDDCAWGTISSEPLACCGRGTGRGLQSTVGSATTEIRTLRKLGLRTFILRHEL